MEQVSQELLTFAGFLEQLADSNSHFTGFEASAGAF